MVEFERVFFMNQSYKVSQNAVGIEGLTDNALRTVLTDDFNSFFLPLNPPYKNKKEFLCFCAPCLHVGNCVPQVVETRFRLKTLRGWFLQRHVVVVW